MRNIAICTPEISYYDAVSNDVFGMYNALAKRGHNVSIFAEVILVRDDSVKDIDRLTDFIKNRNEDWHGQS